MNMRGDVRQIIEAVSGWQAVGATPHRFGGTEFQIGKVEIGHIHHNGMVDIPFTVKTRRALVAEGAAEVHHLLSESGWISYYLQREGSADHALRLYRLSYLHKRSRRTEVVNYADAIAALGFGAAVSASVGADGEA